VTFRKPQAEPVFSPQGQEYAFTNAFHDFVHGKGLSKPWPTSSGPDLGVGMLPRGSLLNAHHQTGEGVAQAGSGTAASAEAPGSAPTRRGGEIVVPLHEGNSSSANGAPGSSAGAGSPAPQPATGQSGQPRVPTREPSSYVIGDLTQPSESVQPKKGATDFQFDKEFTGHLTQEDIDEQVRMEKERKSWNLLKGINPNQDKQIQLPISKDISSYYGPRIHPITKKKSFHLGIDISDKLNAPVRAATYGEVVKVDYDDLGGNYIEVLDVYGRTHQYMHTGSKVRVGDKVQQSQIIGFIDNSGSSTGPHVHYGIKDRVGTHMNPLWEKERWDR